MKSKTQAPIFLLFFLLFTVTNGLTQTIRVQPYLQDANPTSIRILWETTEGEESVVEWGPTSELGNTTTGVSSINEGSARVHEVQLTGLTRFTDYFYRVKTGAALSGIVQFKTPPFASDHKSFRMVAMSDMQRDGNHPNKFSEIVEDGILTYLNQESVQPLSDQLALVIIPGDLVDAGNTYSQWKDHFFDPGQNLFNQVPLYPVPGNHEQNTAYFFNYFHLPDNGSAGFEEHWWYKDYANIRIIGLDSNAPFTAAEQLTWLDQALNQTCGNDSIDFVFAQLHHPHKSELWLPGESDFTGEVISRLEAFTTSCGKPSVHFFGHTHGYSRGQSRDHKHLWVNVATAGGAIDHWGDYPQFDYDEFSKSQEEWGFVVVEVNGGTEPAFTIKRISRGNESIFRDNEVTDSLTVRLHPTTPDQPMALFPVNEQVSPDCVILRATEFTATNASAIHGQSHWQVATDCNDFSAPVAESWKNYENWYDNTDTQAGDDLFDEKIINLSANTSYCWRVRYRDRELNWSEWSAPVSFSTGTSEVSANLLINPGAEAALTGWTAQEGALESLTDGECDGISPHSGAHYFAVGGVCEDGPYGKSVQLVNLSAYADSIDAGNLQANFGGYLSNYNGSDLPAMRLYFLDESASLLDSSATLSTLNASWTMFSEWIDLPIATRMIQFTLTGTRNAGNDNDSYFDDLFLRVGQEMAACDEYLTAVAGFAQKSIELEVVPNPFSNIASIQLPKNHYRQLKVDIRNILGQKVPHLMTLQNDQLILERGNLQTGLYFFHVSDGNQPIGQGKFVVKG